MIKRILFAFTLLLIISGIGFSQAASIRDYVGVINQTYHPSIVDFFEEMKKELDDDGNADAVKAVDRYLRGPFGTGFVYVDDKGDNYIITNNHVINQAYDLKFTFEKPDGSKVIYERVKILAVDEDMDIAVLTFEDKAKPFEAGLPFLTEGVNEGDAIFSAGFPGVGSTPVYQFGSGIVSNRSVRLPVSEDSTETIGPYIQHTAPVDSGNSGGPLLVSQSDAAAKYAVIGINTLKALQRESTNYAIPAGRALEFITRVTGPEQGGQKAKLEERVADFIKEVKEPRAVYEKIANYLSNSCIADNAELALLELENRGNRTVWNNIVREFSYDPVSGMQLAVAWLIENSMRTSSGVIRISLESIVPVNESKYTVTYNINDKSVSSTWELEYGIWRISTHGDTVIGDKSIVQEREKKITNNRNLFTDYSMILQAGAAIMPDFALPLGLKSGDIGFNAGIKVIMADIFTFGSDFTLNGDLVLIQPAVGIMYPIRLGSVAIMPLAEANVNIGFLGYRLDHDNPFFAEIGLGWGAKAGFVFTTKFVRGLYLYGNYHYNTVTATADSDWTAGKEYTMNSHSINVGIGLGF